MSDQDRYLVTEEISRTMFEKYQDLTIEIDAIKEKIHDVAAIVQNRDIEVTSEDLSNHQSWTLELADKINTVAFRLIGLSGEARRKIKDSKHGE
jgi:hypothetical protein